MLHFRDADGAVYAYESESEREKFGVRGLVKIPESEAKALYLPTAEQIKERANIEARAYLSSTDWYVIRLTETGEPVPEEVSRKRKSARESIIE